MTIAFVLQGGGALAAGQVGMLRALLEAGIHPDVVVGSSAGALNALAFAQDPTPRGLEELKLRWSRVSRRDVFPVHPSALYAGLTGHSSGLLSPHRFRAWLSDGLHIRDLGEAVIPVGVVATDADSGDAVMLSRGRALDALLASTAIPGIFPPMHLNGRRLIDGGVSADTPLRQAAELGATLSYVLPRAIPDPSIHVTAFGVLLRAGGQLMDRSSNGEVQARQREVVVLPAPSSPVASPFDFRHTSNLIQSGHDTASDFLVARLATRVGRAEQGEEFDHFLRTPADSFARSA